MTLKRMFFIMFLFITITITTFASPPEYTIIGEYQIVSGLDGDTVLINRNKTFNIYKEGNVTSYKYEHLITGKETSVLVFKPEMVQYEVTFFINGNIDTYFLELRGISNGRNIILKKVLSF